jgi:hypothetical protein
MVVGFTTTYAISAYHNCCEFESRSGQDVQHYAIKFVSDLRCVGGFLHVPHQTNIMSTYGNLTDLYFSRNQGALLQYGKSDEIRNQTWPSFYGI